MLCKCFSGKKGLLMGNSMGTRACCLFIGNWNPLQEKRCFIMLMIPQSGY